MTTLYDMSNPGIPLFLRGIQQLIHILDKGEAWAKENGVSDADLVKSKLAEDMLPLAFQVQMVSNVTKAVLSRVAGFEAISMEDNEASIADCRKRLERTLDYIRQAEGKQDAFKGKEGVEIAIKLPSRELKMPGLAYMQHWVLPNYYFHVTTAYNILRMKGVPVGKMDFLGSA